MKEEIEKQNKSDDKNINQSKDETLVVLKYDDESEKNSMAKHSRDGLLNQSEFSTNARPS
jgi:hypothetical protein